MNIIQGDYFTTDVGNGFDGIFTDYPYKGCFRGAFEEDKFDYDTFARKMDREVNEKAFFITFTNFVGALDWRMALKGWEFKTYMIWDKRPLRTWISWSMPIRSVEFIVFFTRGNYDLTFMDGSTKKKYNRSSFGSQLLKTNPNANDIARGMYHKIQNFKAPRKHFKMHPTEKPVEWSFLVANIVGKDKKVLDPFCGSGSLLKAFENHLGVDIKKWEMEENYHDTL